MRALSRQAADLSLDDLRTLVRSEYHEERLLGLLSLVRKYQKQGRKDPAVEKAVYDLYMKERARINNWDLIDLSAEHIVGARLFERDRSILKKLARSRSVWDRRIAMMSCFYFIRREDYGTALEIAGMLLGDKHDLIHKASGWMLREIGSRSKKTETAFLDRHADAMPRTMLRYAIEKFPERERQKYLARGRTAKKKKS